MATATYQQLVAVSHMHSYGTPRIVVCIEVILVYGVQLHIINSCKL